MSGTRNRVIVQRSAMEKCQPLEVSSTWQETNLKVCGRMKCLIWEHGKLADAILTSLINQLLRVKKDSCMPILGTFHIVEIISKAMRST